MSDEEYINYIIMKISVHLNEDIKENSELTVYDIAVKYLTDKEKEIYIEYFYGLYKLYSKNKENYTLMEHYEQSKKKLAIEKVEAEAKLQQLCIDNPDELTDNELHAMYNTLIKLGIIVGGVVMMFSTIAFGVIELDATEILVYLNRFTSKMFH